MVQKRTLFKVEQNSNTFVCSIFVNLNHPNNEKKVSEYFVFIVAANCFGTK